LGQLIDQALGAVTVQKQSPRETPPDKPDTPKASAPNSSASPAGSVETKPLLPQLGGTTGLDVCADSRAAGRALLAHGFSPDRVKVDEDGLANWEKAGLPVER
jgi:hypothetical protein